MKILLATDGSAHSKAAVEEVTRRPFPLNTKVRIVSAYERTPLITAMGHWVCRKSIMLKPTSML